MRAAQLTEFGGPEVLRVVDDAPAPLVGPDSVLIDVKAAGVNPVDYKIRNGWLQGAYPNILPLTLGWDVAGVVAATGPAVTRFTPGDEVFAYVRTDHIHLGGYAEQIAVPEILLAHKPQSLTFPQAAAVPLAALTAWQSLNAVGTGPGDIVLVHAASGGVGHFAVQLARALGAKQVIGTASERNHDFLRSLGATPVSYGPGLTERVREVAGGAVDVALDFVGGDATAASFELVRNPARVAGIVNPDDILAGGGRYVFVRPDAAGLTELAALADAGKLTAEVQATYPLEDASEALSLVEAGHVRGKVVIAI